MNEDRQAKLDQLSCMMADKNKNYCLCGEPTRDSKGNIINPYSKCSGCDNKKPTPTDK